MAELMTGQTAPSVDADFEVAVHEALNDLQSACAGYIAAVGAAVGGRVIRRAIDLQRALEIPATLAWQVFRVAKAEDLLAEAENVPGTKAVRRLVRAARTKNVEASRLEALSRSSENFEMLVQRHAGNRKTFASLAAGLAEDKNDGAVVQHRRTAFHANSHIVGVQLGTKLTSYIFNPADEAHVDVLSLSGNVGLCRLKRDIPYVLCRTSVTDIATDEVVSVAHHLAVKDITSPGSTILGAFSTRPLPDTRDYIDDQGKQIVELAPGAVGRQHAVDVFTASLYRSTENRYRTPDNPVFGSCGYVSVPAEMWVIDLIVASGTYGDELPDPSACVVATLDSRRIHYTDIWPRYEKNILERPPVMYLGSGAAALESPNVPRYPAMFESVCRGVGWDPDAFHTFRCCVEYPLLSTYVAVGFNYPEKPE